MIQYNRFNFFNINNYNNDSLILLENRSAYERDLDVSQNDST